MARFINAYKGAGYLKYLQVVRENTSKDNKQIIDILQKIQNEEKAIKHEFCYFPNDTVISAKVNTVYSEEEYSDKKFWMNMTRPNNIQGEITEFLRYRLKIYNSLMAFVALGCIVISQIEYELEYHHKMYPCSPEYPWDKSPDYRGEPVRIINSIGCTILTIICCLTEYCTYQITVQQKKNIISPSFFSSFYFKRLIGEIFIALIHPIPYVDFCFNMETISSTANYRLQTFLYAMMFLKFYFILKVLAIYTQYSTKIAEKCCLQFGIESTMTFALKAVQKDSPFTILTASFIFSAIIFGILLRMFEIPFQGSSEDYNFYTNGIWNIIVAMTTVGFGDFYPKTHLGRLIIIVSIVLGTLLTSLTIVALNGISSFNNEENRAFLMLNRIFIRKKLRSTCQKIIKNCYIMKKMRNEKSFSILLCDPGYNLLVRKIKILSKLKLFYKRELSKNKFATEEERIETLERKLDIEISIIKNSIKFLEKLRTKLRVQILEQRKMLAQLDNSLQINSHHIKPYLLTLLIKAKGLTKMEQQIKSNLDNENILAILDLSQEEQKDITWSQLESCVYPTKAFSQDGNSTGPQATTRSQKAALMRNLIEIYLLEDFEEIKERSINASDISFALDGKKDCVDLEYEQLQALDQKSKQIILTHSKKTIDLLASLGIIREKNKEIFPHNQSNGRDDSKSKHSTGNITHQLTKNKTEILYKAKLSQLNTTRDRETVLDKLKKELQEKNESKNHKKNQVVKSNMRRKKDPTVKEIRFIDESCNKKQLEDKDESSDSPRSDELKKFNERGSKAECAKKTPNTWRDKDLEAALHSNEEEDLIQNREGQSLLQNEKTTMNAKLSAVESKICFHSTAFKRAAGGLAVRTSHFK